jgi:hypothetical protein
VLPVDQLVPLPIVGKVQEVVVGELHAGVGRFHLLSPGHALIVVGKLERRVPEWEERIGRMTSLTGRIARANTLSGRQGQTTLYHAVETGRIDVVRYLLAHGARVDMVDGMGRTPIDLAKGRGEIAALLQRGTRR